jgi:predicted adenylyl cyclase CyaB
MAQFRSDDAVARNIEIKARVASIEHVLPIVSRIADQGPIEMKQDDTFFSCSNGRLKLRAFSAQQAELIYYRRSDEKGPKESFYICSPTSAPDSLREALSSAFGQSGRVQKHRTLFLAGRTRIHLDRVKDLGEFLELEVVLEDHEPLEIGMQEANSLLARLGIDSSQLIEGAYVDMLQHSNARAASD